MNNLTTAQTAVAGGIIGTFFMAVIAFYVLTVVASWRIFTKAGEKGWKALIPIYNTYVSYKIVGMKSWFWISLIVSFVLNFIANMNGGMKFDNNGNLVNPSTIALVCFWGNTIFSAVVSVMYAIKLGKAFNKGTGFTVGLVLLPNIFWLILAFGSAKYNKKAVK